jgi:hypothetical protein
MRDALTTAISTAYLILAFLMLFVMWAVIALGFVVWHALWLPLAWLEEKIESGTEQVLELEERNAR